MGESDSPFSISVCDIPIDDGGDGDAVVEGGGGGGTLPCRRPRKTGEDIRQRGVPYTSSHGCCVPLGRRCPRLAAPMAARCHHLYIDSICIACGKPVMAARGAASVVGHQRMYMLGMYIVRCRCNAWRNRHLLYVAGAQHRQWRMLRYDADRDGWRLARIFLARGAASASRVVSRSFLWTSTSRGCSRLPWR